MNICGKEQEIVCQSESHEWMFLLSVHYQDLISMHKSLECCT